MIMARMDDLYNDIYTYCEENECWMAWFTIAEWNENLGTNYGASSYTSLVNTERLVRDKRYGERAYSYRIVPTGKIKERMEAQKEARKRKDAEWVIAHYDEQVARWKADYEEEIRDAEEKYQRYLAIEEEKLEKAKALLGM
jgi:hypothetical protein